MIKRFLKTTLIVIAIFLLIMIPSLIIKTFSNRNCDTENQKCPEKYICNFREKKCVAAEACTDTKPAFCIASYDPVCGNGKEYSNSCVACSNGVKNYYKGTC